MNNGSNFNETIARSRCAFWPPNTSLESEDEKYIFTERNGIYIIDLQKTVKKVDEAFNFVKNLAQDGGKVLFVGTKNKHKIQLETKQFALVCTTLTNVGWVVH